MNATGGTDAALAADADLVRIELSATTEHLRLTRLVVVALATRHGADVHDIDDLRVAADEVCAHLIDQAGSGDRLTVEVSAGPPTPGRSDGPLISLRASVAGLGVLEPLDELRGLVVSATTDRHGIDDAGASSTVWFERALRSGADGA